MKPSHAKQRHLPIWMQPPPTFGHCSDDPNPCLRIACRHHTWRRDNVDVVGRPPDAGHELAGVGLVDDPQPETCSLKLIRARGQIDVQDIARIDNTSVRQVERMVRRALIKLRVAIAALMRTPAAAAASSTSRNTPRPPIGAAAELARNTPRSPAPRRRCRKVIAVRIAPALLDQLEANAAGRTRTTLILEALELWMEQRAAG